MGTMMKKKQTRKPTMLEVKNVISNILIDMSHIQQYISRIDSALAGYIRFKKDTEEYKKWLDKQLKESKNASKKIQRK